MSYGSALFHLQVALVQHEISDAIKQMSLWHWLYYRSLLNHCIRFSRWISQLTTTFNNCASFLWLKWCHDLQRLGNLFALLFTNDNKNDVDTLQYDVKNVKVLPCELAPKYYHYKYYSFTIILLIKVRNHACPINLPIGCYSNEKITISFSWAKIHFTYRFDINISGFTENSAERFA